MTNTREEDNIKANINDVARLAGVSKSTVSRVINDNENVSKITRKKVLNAADKLNYHTNKIAKSLSTNKTDFIGLIIPNIKNPFYSKVCWHAENLLKSKNYKTIICNTNHDIDEESSYIKTLEDYNVDGILLVSGKKINKLKKASKRSGFSCVLIDGKAKNIPSINVDNIYGAKIAVEYLIKLGHQRIVFVTSNKTQAEKERLKGYKKALKENMLFNDNFFVFSKPEEKLKDNASKLINLIKANNITAIFTSNDYKAIKVLSMLRNYSIVVPKDISLIGYDNIETSKLLEMTTISQPLKEMINLSVEIIVNKNNYKNKSVQKTLKPNLISRNTTKPI